MCFDCKAALNVTHKFIDVPPSPKMWKNSTAGIINKIRKVLDLLHHIKF